MVSWCFVGLRQEGHVPWGPQGSICKEAVLVIQRINWVEWMQIWLQRCWPRHIPLPDQAGLQGWRQKPTQGLVASSPTFTLCWGEMGSHTRGGSTLGGQLQPLLAPVLLLVQFSVERPEVRIDQWHEQHQQQKGCEPIRGKKRKGNRKERERSSVSCNAWRSDGHRPRAITANLIGRVLLFNMQGKNEYKELEKESKRNRKQSSKDVWAI